MLKFNSFPPEAGKIEFTDSVGTWPSKADQELEAALVELGRQVAGLLIANMNPPTASDVFRAGYELLHDPRLGPQGADLDLSTPDNIAPYLTGLVEEISELRINQERGTQ